jgi:predicted nucleic acid-binding protein
MKGEEAVVERLASHLPADVTIPPPVIAEIAYGLERLPRSRRRRLLQARFDLVCLEIPRTAWTDAVSHAYGRIKATLVTANLEHMLRVPGLKVEDWAQ